MRTLVLGHQPIGIYQHRSHAAYWDGKNEVGEPVASGVLFLYVNSRRVRSNAEDVDQKIVSNDHRIAGMLMFISFPTIVAEWVELSSLASSLRNDAVSDKHV